MVAAFYPNIPAGLATLSFAAACENHKDETLALVEKTIDLRAPRALNVQTCACAGCHSVTPGIC
jgi:hypothetical protein